jgi:hypothetical protein
MPGSSTTPGRSDLAMVRPKRVAFRTRNGVGTRGLAFAAQWLAYALPYRRFVAVLADANARLGADVDRSGRIEARSGLRMMPTFPRPSLSFRTAGFPQYGWKAGFPSGAFPDRQRLKPAPGVRRQTSGLHPPFVRLVVPTVVPHCVGPQTRLRTAVEDHYSSAPGALARVRVVVSRSVITYSAPSVPLVGTPRFHRMAAYTRCLRCAGAPRRPASGSGLSLLIPSWHAILYDPGESDHRQFQSNDVGMAFAESRPARHSQSSRNPFHAGDDFRGYLVHTFATACQVARPPVRI